MRKLFMNLTLAFLVGFVTFSHFTAKATPDPGTCAEMDAMGYFSLHAGDTVTVSYTETVGGIHTNINMSITADPDYNFTKMVPMLTPGKYTISHVVTADNVYNVYVGTGGATGTMDGPFCIPAGTVSVVGDPDEDGISGANDNCPYAYNPDQEDGWGSGAGDECDSDWYNMTGLGVAGFEQKDGTYHLHGNCTFMADGDPRCPEIAVFDPATFTPDAMPMSVATEAAGTWYVEVNYLHSNNGADVYQVNVYSTTPPQPDTLLDDRLELHINADGTWQWYQRGGSSDYNGI